ncbi:MAG: heme o synthase [Candidatus Caldarchaeum sp.]
MSRKIRLYAVLTKPKITFLNLLTGLVSYFLAGGGPQGALHLSVAGYLSVGGASAINHFLDVDIDSKMGRTSRRPLPSGRLNPRNALVFGLALTTASAVYSLLFINVLTTSFMLMGVLVYVFVYTLWLKRRSVWNIVIGGAAGSCSPLAGWAAAGADFTVVPALLALVVFLWTPGHFWALAIRAAEDYRSAGLPMLPVKHGFLPTAKAILASNLLSVMAALLLTPFVSTPLAYLALVVPSSAWLLHENLKTIKYQSKAHAWNAFKASSPWLSVVFAALLLAWI